MRNRRQESLAGGGCGRLGRASRAAAFTLFELVLVILIVGIAAATIVPAVGNARSSRLRAAANVLAADIEYCQSECIAQPDEPRAIVFDMENNRYTMIVLEGEGGSRVLTHPADGADYVNDFAAGRNTQFGGVTLTRVSMGAATLEALTFDAYGRPLISGELVVTLSYNGQSLDVVVNKNTGDVLIAGA